MHVTLVRISIKPGTRAAFLEATRVNHEASIREPGNRRFDLLADPEDPTRFLLYEWYDSAEGAAAHRETDHFVAWRDTVGPMMAGPRDLEILTGVYPSW